jgi:hypothetical protein
MFVVVTSLPGARLLQRRSFSNRYIRSLLRPARPERVPYQLPSSPSYHNHANFLRSISITLPRHSSKFSRFSSFFPQSSSSSSLGPVLLHYRFPLYFQDFFFLFGGGLSLHKVHCLILLNPREVPTTCFAIFIPTVVL